VFAENSRSLGPERDLSSSFLLFLKLPGNLPAGGMVKRRSVRNELINPVRVLSF